MKMHIKKLTGLSELQSISCKKEGQVYPHTIYCCAYLRGSIKSPQLSLSVDWPDTHIFQQDLHIIFSPVIFSQWLYKRYMYCVPIIQHYIWRTCSISLWHILQIFLFLKKVMELYLTRTSCCYAWHFPKSC